MENVGARSLSIGELLRGKQYTLGYFQRGYNWQRSHIIDLIDDLFDEFNQYWKSGTAKNDDKPPPIYFLGSIIVSGQDEKLSLIDGQQRLTSISLMLIWIAQEYKELGEKILPLVFQKNEKGEQICTLHVAERTEAMKNLYSGERSNFRDKSASVRNLKKRFGDVDSHLIGKDIELQKIEAFINWLIENVYIVEIKTASDTDAYKIFESANDRGLHLSPADIFKSYILSNIEPDTEKERLNEIWKDRISEIQNSGENDLAAIRCWLRAGHAKNTSDFDQIKGPFHRWIKAKVKDVEFGLNSPKDFTLFIEHNFNFYTHWYMELNKIAKNYNPNHESIYWNQVLRYNFQHIVILSSLTPADDTDTIWKKINLVATFIDIFITRRLWNRKSIGHNALEIDMRSAALTIQEKALQENGFDSIMSFLFDKLDGVKDEEKFLYYDPNYTQIKNKKVIHRMLARFSAWLDKECLGKNGSLPNYLDTKIKTGYSIEHILPNKFEQYYTGKFQDEDEFERYRWALGALLLLPASFNKSYGDLPYDKKLPLYGRQDMLLAKTLDENTYERNPALNALNDNYKIQFEFHNQFDKTDIIKRQRVYTRLAKNIWSPERLKMEQ